MIDEKKIEPQKEIKGVEAKKSKKTDNKGKFKNQDI